MKIDDNGIVREMTDEEFAQLTAEDAEPVEEIETESIEDEQSEYNTIYEFNKGDSNG